MTSSPPPTSPALAPPGAGLPSFELGIVNLIFWWTRQFSTKEKSTSVITQQKEQVLRLVLPLSDEAASRPVLIKRLPGMEDSSRFWSVWMTLEHLCMVNTGVSGIIHSLGQNKPIEQVVATANFKPKNDVNSTVVSKFEQSCQSLILTAQELTPLNTKQHYSHPWFGSLDAAGWYAMAGFHLALHRTQIERIIAGL